MDRAAQGVCEMISYPLPERQVSVLRVSLPLDGVRKVIGRAVVEGVGVHEDLQQLIQQTFLHSLFLLVLLHLGDR